MDCQRASVLMMEYIDGEISDIDKKHLLNHIKDCHQCEEEFQLLTETINLVESIDEVEPPLEIEENIMKKVDKNRYKIKRKYMSISLILLAIIPMIVIGYKTAFNNLSMEETLITIVTKFVNFTVITLPKGLAFINDHLLLMLLGTIWVVSSVIISMSIVVFWQVRKQLRKQLRIEN